MDTFIRVAEVWAPSSDGYLLEWSGGWYEHAPALGLRSRQMVFGRAEGLPGQAWEQGHPMVLQPLEGSYFRRANEALQAGLHAAVALPVFDGDRITSLVLLFCGQEPGAAGAIELWRNDPRIGTDLNLADGFYGGTTPAFEALSRDGGIARGTGAPGLAWQRGAAVLIDKLAESRHFLRAQIAAEAGLLRALALPCSTRTADTWVLSLLGSATRPIARRVECWLPAEGGERLLRASGHCEQQGRLGADAAVAAPPAVNAAWLSRAARIDGLGEHGALLAIPLLADSERGGTEVSEVVSLAF